MKKGTLYTVNKWNKPAFMPKENLFGAGSLMQYATSKQLLGSQNHLGAQSTGSNMGGVQTTGLQGNDPFQFFGINRLSNSGMEGLQNWNQQIAAQRGFELGMKNDTGSNSYWDKFASQYFKKGNTTEQLTTNTDLNYGAADSYNGSNASNFGGSSAGAAAAQAVGTIVSLAPNPGPARDKVDPMNILYKGRHNKVGDAFQKAGQSLLAASASTGNYYLAIAGGVANILGGLTNAAWGTKTDEAALESAENAIDWNNAMASKATYFDDISAPIGARTNIHEGGWFNSDDAESKNQSILDRLLFSKRNVYNAYENIKGSQLSDALANYTGAAYGGPIETRKKKNNMKNNIFWDGGDLFSQTPSIDYGMGVDYLINKDKGSGDNTQMKNLFMGAPKTMFDFGGDMQTNSSDFSTGLIHVDAGGSHEESPYDGVQMGVDSEGTPNLVEENETIFNDYVYSTRILMDEAAKTKFHFPKKKDITYAEATKKLEKEIAERANDPISKAGFKAQMETLAEEQERQKAEMEAARAREAFEALSPEEQTALMQRAAQEEAMAQQAAQQQAIEENRENIGEISPNEMQQAQMMQAAGIPPAVNEEAVPMAEGGHLFAKGGKTHENIFKVLGFKTMGEFKKWAKDNKVIYNDPSYWDSIDTPDALDWSIVMQDPNFKKAISKDNPALAHALKNEYDFGTYKPGASTYDFDAFNKVLGEYTKSRKQGNTKGNYAIDKEFGLGDFKTIKDLEDSEHYRNYTNALLGAVERAKGVRWRNKDSKSSGYDNIEFQGDKKFSREDYDLLKALSNTVNGTSTKDKGEPVPVFTYVDDEGWTGLEDDAPKIISRLRTDKKGGIFHLTPKSLTRGTQAKNYVINDDGTIEEIIGDVPTDWTGAGNYAWATPENDIAYNYYKRPAAAVTPEEVKAPEKKNREGEKNKNIAPINKAEWLKYAGFLGPAVGLGLQAAGVGKPDYSELDAAVKSASAPVTKAEWMPIGNYLRYNPLDIWYEQNALNAQSRATDRALLNSGANQGTKNAGLLANGYNSQLASGNLFRQAQEYNDNLKKQVEDFNRGTNMFNAEAYNRNQQFNASEANRGRQYSSQIALQAARDKMDAEADWYNSLYGNIGGLFKGIADIGTENQRNNMTNWMISKGIFGAVDPNDPYLKGRIKTVTAKGGNIKRKKGKRGLTI